MRVEATVLWYFPIDSEPAPECTVDSIRLSVLQRILSSRNLTAQLEVRKADLQAFQGQLEV
jgi:hypothetical protein